MDNKDRDFWKGMYAMATVGLNLVVATFMGLGIGWVIDNKLFHGRTAPWFTLIFLLFGIIAGFKNIYMMTKGKMDNIEDDKDLPKGDFRDKDEDKDDNGPSSSPP